VFIPNAFSPDGDGVNDVFYVMGTGVKIVKSFMIFNRWGELLFQKENFVPNNPSFGWDGTIRGQKSPPDVFVYICNVLCENDIPYSYKGNVAIIK
jgi:gliding motility-associated-like protein